MVAEVFLTKLPPRWIPPNLTDDKSTLVQLMAWCCQATSHYLIQCWPSSMSPYGVTRPQWVNRQQAIAWSNDRYLHVYIVRPHWVKTAWVLSNNFNSLAPGRCGCNLKLIICKLILSRIDTLSISCEIAFRWIPQDLTDDKSRLVYVMVWCHQATIHYLSSSRPTAYLSTSLKLRTYLNLRTRVLKFKYANFALSPTTKT